MVDNCQMVMMLFIMQYSVVLTFESVNDNSNCDHLMNAVGQYFPVVLSVILCRVVLAFKYVDEILQCDHSNES